MKNRSHLLLVLLLCSCSILVAYPTDSKPIQSGEELATTTSDVGRYGGHIVIALRTEPKTLNPVTALDAASRDVIGRMTADLLHIDRVSQKTESALAKVWKVSPDGLHYTLTLRHGLHFSDGHPLDADDVLFSFQVYLDENAHSSQRDLLVVGGKPIVVKKIGPDTLSFDLAQPYAAAERLFDSVAILPRHLLQKAYQDGLIAQAWSLNAPPTEIAGVGPFRLKEYVAGQRLVLERNPYYWKMDSKKQRLPYLDEIIFLFVASEDAQVVRFQANDTDIISRVNADNFALLEKDQAAKDYRMVDLGPGLEYNFLFFNLNSILPKDSTALARHQEWFKQVAFRQAISAAIDREGLIRLVFRGKATPLWTHVTPANKLWLNPAIAHPARSVEKAKELLKSAGFTWKDDALVDSKGQAVEFTILASASNAQRTQMANLIQDDLKQLGIKVNAVPMEFRSLLDRVFQTHDYDAAILALGGGDVDPNPQMNVWLSDGTNHMWDLGESKPTTPWETEIDGLMRKQLSTLNVKERKHLYNRVQELVAQNLPLICLASPNILVGARNRIGNFKPAILDHYVLWNADELYLH